MANTWWDNAEEGRAARYADPSDLDERPTRAQCDQDELELAAARQHTADDSARDILAELVAAVEAAKAAK